MSQVTRNSSAKRKRAKGWGKRRGFNGKYEGNDFSDDDEDRDDLQMAIAVAYGNIEEAKDHDKTSFKEETEEEQKKRLAPFLQKDGTYAVPGAATYMWNDVEWILTFHLAGLTQTKGMFPMLLRRQCTMAEKVAMIEKGMMRSNLKSMNCAAYIWKDAEELLKTNFKSAYDESVRVGMLTRRAFSGHSDETYDGIYNADKDATMPPSSDTLSVAFATLRKKAKGMPVSQGSSAGAANGVMEAAVHAVRDFNAEMLRDRRSLRQVFYDPHTRLVQIPKMLSVELVESLTKEEKAHPAATLPNQFVAAYTEYTPEQMSMLPVDTITKWHVNPSELFPAAGEDSDDEDVGGASDVGEDVGGKDAPSVSI